MYSSSGVCSRGIFNKQFDKQIHIVDKRSENEKGRKTKEKRPVSTLV